MNKEVAQLTAQFMQRVTLQPSEIEAFNAVMQSLKEMIEPSEVSEAPTDG
jgi:hypothetical protein